MDNLRFNVSSAHTQKETVTTCMWRVTDGRRKKKEVVVGSEFWNDGIRRLIKKKREA